MYPLIIERKIKHTPDEFIAMVHYLDKCKKVGFHGPNNYFQMNPHREYFMQIALNKICSKYLKKMTAAQITGPKKHLSVMLDLIELHTMSILFLRVDTDPYTIALQSQFCTGLEKINRLTNHLQ